MAGRREADEGDEGDAGNRLLNRLVREPLEVSVRNGQPNVVIDLLQYAVTPEIVAWLLACRTEQILPAIEDYLYKQKGLDRGDVD